MISGLVSAYDQGDRLTTDELIATAILLVFAGHYTTMCETEQWTSERRTCALAAGDLITRIDQRTLVQFLRGKLADYKVPRQIMVLPALPRNATGKVLKTSLREMARAAKEESPE